MKIRMYNVGYGDCFCIRDRRSSLLVDFGTSNLRIDGKTRNEVFDVIISDLSTIENKNLLLTHFHLDHLSGLLYMLQKQGSAGEFGTVYLPDVFSSPEQNRTLVLLILADLMQESYLPGRQVSLFTLVQVLLTRPQRIVLLHRGMEFEGKYQALWPDRDVLAADTDALYQELMQHHHYILKKLEAFADRLRRIVLSQTERSGTISQKPEQAEGMEPAPQEPEVADGRETEHPSVYALEQELRMLKNSTELKQLTAWLQEQKTELRDFKNKIGIVFQNIRDGELNLLFTGDADRKYMQMLAENYDGRFPLHTHYWCIKVPCHGIEDYYFDFSGYTPENMLISNGVYHLKPKERENRYRVSPRYSGLFYINGTYMHCSSRECCCEKGSGCTCKESDIISPGYYRDI